MKPIYQQLLHKQNEAFLLIHVEIPYFVVPWHYHKEYELINIKKGYGTRFVGDNMSSFSENDLVLMGSNLPHVWKNDEKFHQIDSGLMAEAFVLFFNKETFGETLWDIEELKKVKKLLGLSSRGVSFQGKSRKSIIKLLAKLYASQGFDRFRYFWELLNEAAHATEYDLLASNNFSVKEDNEKADRLSSIIDYIMKNYKNRISLEEISSMANMTPNSFCRYFKQRTNKSVFNLINELRVSMACKLLADDSLNIVRIAHESGFRSLSNFNEQFKIKTGFSPKTYRKEIKKSTWEEV